MEYYQLRKEYIRKRALEWKRKCNQGEHINTFTRVAEQVILEILSKQYGLVKEFKKSRVLESPGEENETTI